MEYAPVILTPAKIAANYIREAGMENRISLLVGNFNQDSIGLTRDL